MPNVKHFSFVGIEESVKFKRVLKDILYIRKLKSNSLAEILDLPPERVYKWVNPDNPYNNFPACILPRFIKKVGDEVLRFLASEAGYGIVKFPNPNPELKEAVKVATEALRECSEALEKYASAIDDGHVTLREKKEVGREVDEAIQALLGLKEMVNEMNRKDR